MSKKLKTPEATPETLATFFSKKATVTVEDKIYPLVLTNSVLIELEDLTGISALIDLADKLQRPTLKFVSHLIFLLLRKAGATYSLDQVIDLCTASNIVAYTEAVTLAWVYSNPELKKQLESEADSPTIAKE